MTQSGFSKKSQRRLSLKLMLSSMTVYAKGDEVLCRVVPQLAAKFPVMDLQVSQRPTYLASPAIPREDIFVEELILLRMELESGCSLAQAAHGGSDLARHWGIANSLSFSRSAPSRANVSSRIILQARSRQKIRTDHLKAVPTGFVGSQHQASSLQSFLDYY